ncbi:MAG: hypothetical protein WBN04_05150 [Paracoccaceae bacterium]
MEEMIARISPSPFRRVLAIGILLVLGGLLIYLALARPPAELIWQAFLLLTGGLVLYLADQVRRATALTIELSDGRIFDSAGRELCRLDEIKSIERGAFAFKPSNGFLIHLKSRKPRVWAPGLWWRTGRRVGVGGVTPASQAKFMSEMIAYQLRDNPPD